MAKPHVGRVVEVNDDLTIDVDVPSLADSVIEGIRPESVGPILWTPAVGQRVALVEVLGATPATALRWRGKQHVERDEDESDAVELAHVPTDLDPGDQRWRSAEGRAVVQLEDGNDDLTEVALRLGRKDADEPLVIGTVYQGHAETTFDMLAELIDALDAELVTMDTLDTAHSVWVGAVAAHPLLAAVLAGPGTTMQTALAAHRAAITTARALLKGVPAALRERFVGATVPAGNDQKTLIPAHLSNFVFTAKAPEQGQ